MYESKRIEYKQKITAELEKEVVAFLNSNEGGVIYIGIDKIGNIVGIENPDEEQLLLKDRFKHNILPSCMGLFDIVLERNEDKNILKIIVAGGYEKPYYVKKYGLSEKGVFIRVGSSAEPMPTRQIEQLFSKRTRNSIGKIKSPKQDLRFQQLQIYYQSIGKLLNEQFAKNLELLTEDNQYNYVAYLLNDVNGISVKVAKYDGLDRVDLIENNENGYCSLMKATKQVLDKIEVENKTLAKITSKERKETKLWNPVALREAVINAIVHNDYTSEVPPKFEFFDDRVEITSFGSLPQGMTEKEFFEGYSVPRNKELMRVFRDLDLVEHLGSGVPRILRSYGKECFKFTENFLRMIFPATAQDTAQVTAQDTAQVTAQVKDLIKILSKEMDRQEIQDMLGLSHRENFRLKYLKPALEQGFIEMTIPERPSSKLQKYRLTILGKQLKDKL